MKVSVVIVNYNVKYFLEQALLAALKAAERVPTEIFVVDNNSVDDSVEMVREKFPQVKLIANKENVGFSIANNQAMRQAKGEYILLLNPDTVVSEDTFERCANFMDAHPDGGGLGVKMIDGKGVFLPESKRGMPSPMIALYKMFGLGKLFPKSKRFNYYYLGHLDNEGNHEVEILSGAFMWMRKSVLDEIGLLDETFFMYGEDIDLSYRILEAGYKNYYLSDTCIIHYKGESTKKGSVNYVRTFYQAMIIFVKKHFHGQRARVFVRLLSMAIYIRAALTLLSNFAKKAYLPLLDACMIFVGMFFLKDMWATLRFGSPDYFQPSLLYVNIPLYISIWLINVYYSGGYDDKRQAQQLIRGLLTGTLIIAAVYGFLPSDLRASRMLIVLGAVWATVSMVGFRVLWNFLRHGNFMLQRRMRQNLVIVGTENEAQRCLNLMHRAQVFKNFIGVVAPENQMDVSQKAFLGDLNQLKEIVHIYKVDEVIFCARDVRAEDTMHWMTRLGAQLDYKIIPEDSASIIGSNSKNSAGDLYTIEVRFAIDSTMGRRNKRVFDVLAALGVLLCAPLVLFWTKKPWTAFQHALQVLAKQKTWVGYAPHPQNKENLPALRANILTPADALPYDISAPETFYRLNLLYAKSYKTQEDWRIFWRSRAHWGRTALPQATAKVTPTATAKKDTKKKNHNGEVLD